MNLLLGALFRFIWNLPALLWESLVCLAQWFVPLSWYAKDVSSEVALITGASSGLGQQLALEYAKLGASLVLWDVNEAGLRETKKLVQQEYAKSILRDNDGRPSTKAADESRFCLTYRVDVSDRNEVYAQAKKLQEDLERMGDQGTATTATTTTTATEAHPNGDERSTASKYVSILVNNAGIYHGLTLQELSDLQIERVFKINIMAHFWTVRAFLPEMIKRQHGHIVEIASMAGISGLSKQVDYCATKFATVGFEESLSLELADMGLYEKIRTTAVCPLFFQSNLFTGFNGKASAIMSCRYVARRAIMGMRCNHSRVLVPPGAYLLMLLRPLTPRRGLYLWAKVLNLMEGIRDVKGAAAC